MYGKVFESIYDGTLAGHWQAIVTMQQLVVLATKDGIVDMTPQAIASRTSIPLEIITAGIEHLEKPDPQSRSPEEEGRRIVRLDAHRPWGWRLVNHAKYRDLRDQEQKRQADRDRIRASRAGHHQVRKGYVYFATAGKDGPIKIGYSANPWARVNDLQVGSAKPVKLLVAVAGDDAEERRLHAEFAALRLEGEWFKRSPELMKRINDLRNDRSATDAVANYVAHADAEAEAKTEKKKPIAPSAAAPGAGRLNGHDQADPVVERVPLNDGTEFEVRKSIVDELERLYPAVDAPQTLREIRGWNITEKARRKTRGGVLRHIFKWFAREQDKAGRTAH